MQVCCVMFLCLCLPHWKSCCAFAAALQVFEQLLVHGDESTLDTFFQVLRWIFACLLKGNFPTADWAGEEHLACSFMGCAVLSLCMAAKAICLYLFVAVFLLCPCKRYSSGSEDFLRAGKPLCGGWKAALVSVQGDLDFFAASLGLPRWSLKEGG